MTTDGGKLINLVACPDCGEPLSRVERSYQDGRCRDCTTADVTVAGAYPAGVCFGCADGLCCDCVDPYGEEGKCGCVTSAHAEQWPPRQRQASWVGEEHDGGLGSRSVIDDWELAADRQRDMEVERG